MRLHRRSLGLLLATLPLRRPALAEPLDELMQMLARIPERRASFTEEKTLAVLTRPLSATGRLFYRRPGHLEKITLEPQAESLVVDGNRLALTEPGGSPRVIDLDAEPAIRALVDAVRGTLSGDLPALRRSYAVMMEGPLAHWRLTLTPTEPSVARLIVRTTIEGATTAILTVETTQTNGDRTRMSIRPNP